MRKCYNECNDFPELKNKELGNMTLQTVLFYCNANAAIKEEQENYIQEMQIQMKTQQTNILAQFIA